MRHLILPCLSRALTLAAAAFVASSWHAQAADDTTAAYCTDHGGTVETREPYWGTNLDQSQWVRLTGSIELCMFAEADDHAVRIYVDTTTLASRRPTLAAAAYLAKVPLTNVPPGVNPAAVDCNQIVHGSSTWGTSLSGGGWVNFDDPDFTVVDLCVFPDGSAIDEWGITYYAGGVVRGTDLAPLFRFDQDVVPQLFPPSNTTTAASRAPSAPGWHAGTQ
jgi:putative hemolysin